jgi:putative ABC transport system permease protein
MPAKPGGEMLRNYLKIALRNIRKHKGYSYINISGLALGMACCLLIVLFVRDELSYDRYHENADQIYRVIKETESKGKRSLSISTPPPLSRALVDDFPEVINSVRLITPTQKEILVSYEDKKFYETRFFFADPSFFDIFTFPLFRGNPETALQEPYSLLITEEMSEKYFGDEDPLGKIITYNNKDDYKITGILKNIPHNSHFRFDFLASFTTLNHYFVLPLDDWGSNALYTYILIQERYSPEKIEKRFAEFVRRHVGENHFLKDLYLQPLADIHLHSHLRGEIESNSDLAYIYIFSAIAILILIIGCFNFVNLSTARHMNRAKEVGMRKIMGADRLQIIKQYLGESILFSLTALPVALVLVEFFLPVFNSLVKKELTVGYISNFSFVITMVSVTFLVGVVSGIYPALFLSSFQPVRVLKAMFRTGPSRSALRSVLVLTQFSITILLITCTVVINNQLNFVKNTKLGFDKDHVIILPIKERSILRMYQPIKNELLRNSNILKVAVSSDIPGKSGVNSNPFRPEGFDLDNKIFLHNMRVDYDFIEALEIEIKEGRAFSEDYLTDASGAFILNEAAVQEIGWQSPIDKQLEWFPGGDRYKKGTVIGVIKDFHFKSLHKKIEPLVLHIWPRSFDNIVIRTRPDDLKGTLVYIRNKWNEFTPNYPFVYSFLDEDFDKLYKSEERLGKIFIYFSLLSIFIACLGLVGLASFSTEQRTKEIGIRKVLGASVSNIVLLLSKEFTKWVLIANIIAWPITFYTMNRWLQNFAYRVNIGIWTLILTTLFAFMIALVSVSYQSIKVALANPVESLKYE